MRSPAKRQNPVPTADVVDGDVSDIAGPELPDALRVACRVVCARAHDAADARELLAALGLIDDPAASRGGPTARTGLPDPPLPRAG